jgi:hypothetical protein
VEIGPLLLTAVVAQLASGQQSSRLSLTHLACSRDVSCYPGVLVCSSVDLAKCRGRVWRTADEGGAGVARRGNCVCIR